MAARRDPRVERLASFGVNEAINDLIEGLGNDIPPELDKALRKWALASDRNIAKRKNLKKVNIAAAEAAKSGAIEAYRNSDLGDGPSYRDKDRGVFKRYSGGKVEKGILNDKTYNVTDSTVAIFIKSNLDRFALQWYRLNFGTTPGRNEQVDGMELYGVPLRRSPTLAGYKTSKDFTMPKGIWSSTFKPSTISGPSFAAPNEPARRGGAKNAFYAVGARNPRPKTGEGRLAGGIGRDKQTGRSRVNQIVGRSFLDRGVEKFNKEYSDKLEPLLVTWLQDFD